MKRKKILIILASIIVMFFVAVSAAPYIFKDQIEATINAQIEANLDADVLYDINDLSLSLFSNFPNLTASIKELGIVGRGAFAGEVLFAIDEFEVEVSLSKLLFNNQTSIHSINLTNPQIFIKVLADGSANYDIVKGGEETADENDSSESSDFSLAIESWQITGGRIIYDDATIPTYVSLENLNHSGSGNFSLSIFDLATKTDVTLKEVRYAGENYFSNRQLTADLILNMDFDQMKFAFKENTITLNDFSFGFDGWLAIPQEDITMDITFHSNDNSFKSLISLIPALYTEEFNELKSSGTVSFNGSATGVLNDTSIPAFKINLAVVDGMFQYPDLPEAVSNVAIQMMVANDDGNIEHTKIDVAKFHIDFGTEPLDAFIKIDNLINYPLDMGIKTTLNLANLSKLFPTEGLDMAGILKINFTANGIYDSIKGIIPKFNGILSLTNGKIIYADVAAPLTDLAFSATINNSTGYLNDTKVVVSAFNMSIDGSPVKGSAMIENFDNYQWQADLEGNLDFDKLFPVIDKIYPMPGTLLGGEIATKFKTEGNMADVDAGHYDRLSTSGSLRFKNFNYSDSVSLPQGLIINSGEFSFTPNNMTVKSLNIEVGKSDFIIDGTVSNYIKYIFNDDATIIGILALKSKSVDLNEWMTTEETDLNEGDDAQPYVVIEVPQNIDFTMQANIDNILYENIVLKNARGKIIVKNGILYFNKLTTSTLGGTIVFDGNYNTQDPAKPTFNMNLGVDNVAINQAYSAFNSVQALVPIARHIDGKVSTNFTLSGILQEDMMPDLKSIRGSGLFTVSDAVLGNSELVAGLTEYLKGAALNSLTLQDIAMHVSVEDGKLRVKPFDFKINNYKATVGGTTDIDGTIDYKIKLDIPAGQIGTQVNALLGSLTGSTNNSDIIKLNLGMAGTYDNPKISLLGTDSDDIVKDAVINQLIKVAGGVQSSSDSVVNTDVNALVDEQKLAVEAELKKQEDSLRKAAELEVELAKKKVLEEANKQLKNLFGPKKKKNNN